MTSAIHLSEITLAIAFACAVGFIAYAIGLIGALIVEHFNGGMQ